MNNKVLPGQGKNGEIQNEGGLNRREALGVIAGAVFGTATLARETLAGELQLAQEAKDIKTAQQIQKIVLATEVKDASYYEGFITHPKFKEDFKRFYSQLDLSSQRYFAYIAESIISSGGINDKVVGVKLAILANFFARNPAAAGDIETIKDIVERYPATKDKFHDLADINSVKIVGPDSPLGIVILWNIKVGGRKNRQLT